MAENKEQNYMPSQRKLYDIVFQSYEELGGSATNKDLNDKVVEKVIKKMSAELKNSDKTEEEIEKIIDEVITRPKENDYRTDLEYNVAWVQQALKHAGVLINVKRGTWKIIPNYDNKELTKEDILSSLQVTDDSKDIEQELNLFNELTKKVQNLSSTEFEHLVGYWLKKRGFSDVKVTGGPNDKGIDGTAKLKVNDFITLNVIFQCKHYSNTVQSNVIREFKGSFKEDTDIGILVTTNEFSGQRKSKEAVLNNKVGRIILVNGKNFIDDLIEYEIGVKKEVDDKFFIEKPFYQKKK